jgi:hypothetical protein
MAIMGRIVTAVAGRAVARSVGGIAAGPAGLVLGAALPMLARRLGPMGMIGVAVGAWAINKVIAERAAALPDAATPDDATLAVLPAIAGSAAMNREAGDALPGQIANARSPVTS